jgi:hypothetical protein
MLLRIIILLQLLMRKDHIFNGRMPYNSMEKTAMILMGRSLGIDGMLMVMGNMIRIGVIEPSININILSLVYIMSRFR